MNEQNEIISTPVGGSAQPARAPQSKTHGSKRRSLKIAAAVALLAVAAGVAWLAPYFMATAPQDAMLYLRRGSSIATVGDSLRAKTNDAFTARVVKLLNLTHADLTGRHGAFKIEKGTSAWAMMRLLRSGPTTPVKVTFNNVRTKRDLARRVTAKLMISADDLLAVLNDSALVARYGMDTTTVVAMFLPDTYEFHWDISAQDLVARFHDYYDKFWTPERQAQAKREGLTPLQVSVLASIVDEETAKADEKPLVARLYLNRLARNIKLQADPTVKFALGDFAIRRITLAMLNVDSPYNTYRVAGLPPGPIRVPAKATLEAVLEAPQHDYIYMCAKEDFSGYHNFATTLAEHEANARRYHQALNERKIK